ncbi:scramblase (macronuclear) [Tetrahymena thermophila SB210]|uniref:Phospholipid scramblase n=1 Tax=Tetrahymena thermophila (strain SB210) TaxID=312017 RepID=Q24C42_TETTS|nr:scramblase [Tetrahymena thermophila SB210]EAS05396.1 scramblase [Tetrahymena thermophila SB210]|eukprot:XP_001025641.1 scramblase [Tetrahymena thermophila SB210]
MYNPLAPNQNGNDSYQFLMMSGFQKFQNLPGVFLKEDLQPLEVICGINMPCNFQVFPADVYGNQAGEIPLFQSKEHSECCQRVCLPASCRSYDIQVNSYNSGPFLQMHRSFRCTCLCCNRPEVEVNVVDNGQNLYAGKVVNPFYCCDLGVHVYDRAHNLKFIVEGSCCQCGVLCRPWPCESCQTVYFDVKSPDGTVLSNLIKRSPGCLKACITNLDNFSVVFPPNASVEDKALLTATALLINYSYFEETPQQKNQQNGY